MQQALCDGMLVRQGGAATAERLLQQLSEHRLASAVAAVLGVYRRLWEERAAGDTGGAGAAAGPQSRHSSQSATDLLCLRSAAIYVHGLARSLNHVLVGRGTLERSRRRFNDAAFQTSPSVAQQLAVVFENSALLQELSGVLLVLPHPSDTDLPEAHGLVLTAAAALAFISHTMIISADSGTPWLPGGLDLSGPLLTPAVQRLQLCLLERFTRDHGGGGGERNGQGEGISPALSGPLQGGFGLDSYMVPTPAGAQEFIHTYLLTPALSSWEVLARLGKLPSPPRVAGAAGGPLAPAEMLDAAGAALGALHLMHCGSGTNGGPRVYTDFNLLLRARHAIRETVGAAPPRELEACKPAAQGALASLLAVACDVLEPEQRAAASSGRRGQGGARDEELLEGLLSIVSTGMEILAPMGTALGVQPLSQDQVSDMCRRLLRADWLRTADRTMRLLASTDLFSTATLLSYIYLLPSHVLIIREAASPSQAAQGAVMDAAAQALIDLTVTVAKVASISSAEGFRFQGAALAALIPQLLTSVMDTAFDAQHRTEANRGSGELVISEAVGAQLKGAAVLAWCAAARATTGVFEEAPREMGTLRGMGGGLPHMANALYAGVVSLADHLVPPYGLRAAHMPRLLRAMCRLVTQQPAPGAGVPPDGNIMAFAQSVIGSLLVLAAHDRHSAHVRSWLAAGGSGDASRGGARAGGAASAAAEGAEGCLAADVKALAKRLAALGQRGDAKVLVALQAAAARDSIARLVGSGEEAAAPEAAAGSALQESAEQLNAQWRQTAVAGHALPAIVGPVTLPQACSNPLCDNFSGASEAELRPRRCAGCRAARYCRPECQRQHWQEGHKEDCGKSG
ncbi:hypothetical protein GPECTOR_2g1399 [Gonium pectorale]|uniref:phytol kinase n=1 Tax=Gonium pectorale TaxID=33097 RepID=A0A150H1X9_GONPE|nr:hypothetical protein GPECTOR_2g1399 [Gonium pectorale]|eukprot:KXZ55848.1 hypothetical protein GPECTOR_2g1399 [Gonium pectorale]